MLLFWSGACGPPRHRHSVVLWEVPPRRRRRRDGGVAAAGYRRHRSHPWDTEEGTRTAPATPAMTYRSQLIPTPIHYINSSIIFWWILLHITYWLEQ